MLIRPMTLDDVPAAARLSDAAFFELDSRQRRATDPEPQPRPPAHQATWESRTAHFVRTDPGGCWVAEDETGMVGMATSFRRETLWCLATYAVRPGQQGRGIGRPLLAAAMGHARGCTRAMLASSADAKAVRVYHRAGFALHPQMHLTGPLDRSLLPAVTKVREGSASDIDLMDSVDRAARGAGHGPDHEWMLKAWRLLVSDSTTGSGYAYVDERGRLALLGASNRRTATRLLWTALAEGGERAAITHVTGANQWALDVGFAARLDLTQEGYLGLRGMKPPVPYVHHGALL